MPEIRHRKHWRLTTIPIWLDIPPCLRSSIDVALPLRQKNIAAVQVAHTLSSLSLREHYEK